MANKKISSLNSLGGTPDVADIIPITDVSDTTGSVNGTTKKVTVANLVAAAPQGDLVASNNLSDVASATTSRTNLGLGTAATQDVGTANGNLVQLDSTGLPAVDGSQLTNLPAGSLFNTIVSETTTARTLSDSDCGKVINCSNASAVTLTIPNTLTAGFTCTVVQSGAGKVTIAAGTSVSVQSYSSSATAGQYSAINIIPIASNSYVLEGDLAASGGGGGSFTNTYSLYFDQTNDSLDIGDISSLAGGQSAFSMSLWFNLPSTSGVHGILGSNNFFAETYYYNAIVANNFNVNAAANLGTVTANTWNHLVITFNSGTTTRYVNGSSVGNRTDSQTTTDSTLFNGLKLGVCPRFSQYGDVKIDEFAVFQSELSASQVTNIYKGESDGGSGGTNGTPGDLASFQSGNGPNGWWRMGDTGSDYGTSTITDAGSGGNDGTMTNSPSFSTDVP